MDDDKARNRFLAISLLRLAGALLVMFGLVIAAGRLPDVPRIVGIIAVLVGAADFALVPLLLARRWRTPK
jgi:hypothetical protein